MYSSVLFGHMQVPNNAVHKRQDQTGTVGLCRHLLECCNRVVMVTDINFKSGGRHQNALALDVGPRFLPTIAQLQQSGQSSTVLSSAGQRRRVQCVRALQGPQRHWRNGRHLGHCSDKPHVRKEPMQMHVTLRAAKTHLAVGSPPYWSSTSCWQDLKQKQTGDPRFMRKFCCYVGKISQFYMEVWEHLH